MLNLSPAFSKPCQFEVHKFAPSSKLDGLKELDILVHGGPGMSGYMDPLAKELATHGRFALTYTQRSKTLGCNGPYTLESHIQDLQKLIMTQSKGKPVRLIGHSWGAVLALEFTKKYPTLVSKLILIGMGPSDLATFDSFQSRIEQRFSAQDKSAIEYATKQLLKAKSIPQANKWFAEVSRLTSEASYFGSADHSNFTANYDYFGHSETWRDYQEQIESEALVSPLSKKIPVQLIHGDRDPVPLALVVKNLKQQIQKLQVTVIKGAGHMPWLETETVSQCFYEALLP